MNPTRKPTCRHCRKPGHYKPRCPELGRAQCRAPACGRPVAGDTGQGRCKKHYRRLRQRAQLGAAAAAVLS
ncbi:MAG TPA: hypothetical protein VF814_04695 [Casimicrobiaceae bacterium]